MTGDGGERDAGKTTADPRTEVESEDALRLARFSLDRAGDAVYWIDPQGRFDRPIRHVMVIPVGE